MMVDINIVVGAVIIAFFLGNMWGKSQRREPIAPAPEPISPIAQRLDYLHAKYEDTIRRMVAGEEE
tara:strand:- start:2449 stop:2646 length:198 start_codon:yes stop_codon:yes gene_type:complete